MSSIHLRDDTLDRMVRAVEKVRERLLRAATALSRAGIDYAVAGGNAVAVWVAQVDEGAVRNTRDVNILVRRDDLNRVRVAMEEAGFVYRHLAGVDLFLDGEGASPREGVHVTLQPFATRPDLGSVWRMSWLSGLSLCYSNVVHCRWLKCYEFICFSRVKWFDLKMRPPTQA